MGDSSGVYAIRNVINGKRYIGSSIALEKRWRGHLARLRRRAHNSRHLQAAFLKYGERAFEFGVLLRCDPINNTLYEQMCINHLRPEYNLAPKAGSTLGVRHSSETRRKWSEQRRGRSIGPHSDATRAKIAAARRGQKASAETRLKLSISRIGNKNSLGHRHSPERRAQTSARLRGNDYAKGFKHTAETRAKISAAGVGREKSPETRLKLSLIRRKFRWSEEMKARLRDIHNTPEVKARHSEATKKAWKTRKRNG